MALEPGRRVLLRKQTQCGALAAEGSGAAGRCSGGSGASSVALPRAAWISSPMLFQASWSQHNTIRGESQHNKR